MAAIKFILRFAADNLATTKILFIYYKLKYNFVVKIPNGKSGKMMDCPVIANQSSDWCGDPPGFPESIGDCHGHECPRNDVRD